jgi:hypothetical protein
MKGCLRIVRGNEVKLTLPGPSITIKADGTLWFGRNPMLPILGSGDGPDKQRMADLVKAGKYDQIPAIYFTRLGDNPNGLWTGTDEEWAKHPAKAEQDRVAAAKAAETAKQVRIYLSSRGWGDYSGCEWIGDITRPDAEILAECKHILTTGHDVDQPNQSDNEIMSQITKARADWESAPARKAAREAAEEEDIRRKIASGYCFACESYCHGDCGNYSSDPRVMYRRQLNEATREANYGIED